MGRRRSGSSSARTAWRASTLPTPEFASAIGLILYVKENIMKEGFEGKNFDRILRNLSFGSYLRKFKEFIKQYIP